MTVISLLCLLTIIVGQGLIQFILIKKHRNNKLMQKILFLLDDSIAVKKIRMFYDF